MTEFENLLKAHWSLVARVAEMPEVQGQKNEQMKQLYYVYGYSRTEIETFLGISK